MTAPTLQVNGISKTFGALNLFGRGRVVKALTEVSFQVQKGEAFGLVGESGSGKSTLGRIILRLMQADSGDIRFEGRSLFEKGADMADMRRRMQAIFQDPYAALNPRMQVGTFIAEPLRVHGLGSRSERTDRVAELLREVGLDPSVAGRYPHEFSGGQRQRLCIARALALKPALIVADEPVTALDMSIQAQIVNLMQDMQEQHGLAYVFIAHDLNVVRHMCQRAAVMYAGRIVETGPVEALFGDPRHPYTRSLIAAVPKIGTGKRRISDTATSSLAIPAPEARLVQVGEDHFVLE